MDLATNPLLHLVPSMELEARVRGRHSPGLKLQVRKLSKPTLSNGLDFILTDPCILCHFREVMSQLRKENNPLPATATSGGGSVGGGNGAESDFGGVRLHCPTFPESYPSPTMSPTLSSRSSMCGRYTSHSFRCLIRRLSVRYDCCGKMRQL